MEGENQKPSEDEPKELTLDEVREYFSSMQDPEDDPSLTAAIVNGSKGNFFDKKNSERFSAYELVVKDAADYKMAEENYKKEGKLNKAEEYKKAKEDAEKIAIFLEKLLTEKKPGELNESDDKNIVSVFGNEINPKKPTENAREQEPKEPITSPPPIEISTVTQEKEKGEEEPEKKEREYTKLGKQLEKFKTLWIDNKEKEFIELAKEISGGKEVKDKIAAKEIYSKKLGLHNTATKIISDVKIKKQLKDLADAAREKGEYKKGGKIIKLEKEDKINGRLILGKNNKYYFEFAGKMFFVEKRKKLESKHGRPPSEADGLKVPVEAPEKSKDQPVQEQAKTASSEPTSEPKIKVTPLTDNDPMFEAHRDHQIDVKSETAPDDTTLEANPLRRLKIDSSFEDFQKKYVYGEYKRKRDYALFEIRDMKRWIDYFESENLERDTFGRTKKVCESRLKKAQEVLTDLNNNAEFFERYKREETQAEEPEVTIPVPERAHRQAEKVGTELTEEENKQEFADQQWENWLQNQLQKNNLTLKEFCDGFNSGELFMPNNDGQYDAEETESVKVFLAKRTAKEETKIKEKKNWWSRMFGKK